MKKAVLLIMLVFATTLSAQEPIPATDRARLIEQAGKEVVVRGKVISTNISHRRKILFINFGTELRKDFAAVSYAKFRNVFGERDLTLELPGKEVEVRGVLSVYKGQPQINLQTAEQLRVLE